MATRDEIKSVIAYLKLAFPNYHPELSGEINTVDVLTDLLGDIPADALMVAVKAACAEPGRQFAPSAGEIRGKLAELHAKAAEVPTAAEAWGAVMESFRCVTSQRPALLKHPLVAKAVRMMGGLDKIGMSETIGVERAHFFKFYEQLLKCALEDASELAGVTKYVLENRVNGEIRALSDKLSVRRLSSPGTDASSLDHEIADERAEIMRRERAAVWAR
ncbi:MAG: hypothetical protein BroJett011_78510 [Chloroflexota bacterium]|nr:hypothetical protein [Chloroflexota bacterium]NOG75279.1 hypothetical protein [Chloroflexota bacterium]GIK44018.1 MAG: hypothetical protein BroJett011_78510 [Chloroflexota bacterium]